MNLRTWIKSFYLKRRIKNIVRRLPGEWRADIYHEFMKISDLPDRGEKIRLTHELFIPYRQSIDPVFKEKVLNCEHEYKNTLSNIQSNALMPLFALPSITINQDLLEQKIKAKLNLEALEREIMSVPKTRFFNLFVAILGVFISLLGTYATFNAMLGNDWLGGNESLSTAINGIFSLIVIMVEAISFYSLIHYMPKKSRNGLNRLLGIVGAILVILSISMLIFSRSEIGSNVVTTIEDTGVVE